MAAVNRPMATMAVMSATIMQVLDTTIANVALPSMQGSLSASQDQISWVLTSYIVASAIATPLTGFLAGQFGRKRLFAVSVVGFTIASMLCGAATSLTEIVLFRVLQGLFGAALVPLSQATLFDIYPREQHGKAMALWGMGIMGAPILGPTLGGYLTEYWNWRWVFYINLPIGILSAVGVLAFVPETKKRDWKFDWFGFCALSLAVGSLQMMLDRGELKDWFSSPEIIAEAILAGAAAYFFLVHLTTAKRPFFPPEMFKDRNLAAGMIIQVLIGAVVLSTLTLLPPFMQGIMNYPVLSTGILLAPRGIGTLIGIMIVGRAAGRMDTRWLMIVGCVLIAASLFRMSGFTADVPVEELVFTGVVQGFGMGMVFPPLSALAFATLPESYRTEAASLMSLVRNLGQSVGLSIVVATLTRNTQVNHAELVTHLTPFDAAVRHLPAPFDPSSQTGLALLDQLVNREALVIGYLNEFHLLMWVVLAIAPIVLLLRPVSRAGGSVPVAE